MDAITERQFLKTMIELVKYEEYDSKDELLGILRNSIIKYRKTSKFALRHNQCWESIELRVPIPMLSIARKFQNVLRGIASEVYQETNEYAFSVLDIRPKPVELDNVEYTQHDVVFDEIKDTIIQGIRNAKYTVWVAVAWFTDYDIFQELLLRKKEGVNVRIITSDEDTNTYLIKELESNFEVVKIKQSGYNLRNRFHDKFCIIDFEFVMHGSYNWSKNARNNDETLATALDRDFVKRFADEFMILFNKK